MRNLYEWLAQATGDLAAVSALPRVDAERLLMHVTGYTRTELLTHEKQTFTHEQADALASLLSRRVAGEPLAYLTGECEFWSLPLRVTRATLIPRPETEHLVELALARIPKDAHWLIADLGTGSGAIALALAKERPECRVIGIDSSPEALAVARDNQRRLAIDNVEWREGDWCSALNAPVDMIVSNPPYVASGDTHLQGDGVRFEPRQALAAGADGLDAIRHIIACAASALRAGGSLILEHGWDQRVAVGALLRQHGYEDIVHVADYAGHDRISAARQPE